MKVMIMCILLFWLLPVLPVWGEFDVNKLKQRFNEAVDQEVDKIKDKVATEYLGEGYTEEELKELEEYLWREQEKRKQRAIERWKHTQEPDDGG